MISMTEWHENLKLSELFKLALKTEWIIKSAQEQSGFYRSGDRSGVRFGKTPSLVKDTPEAMDWEANATKMKKRTEKEKRDRKRNGQCLYCGETGHFRDNCQTRIENEGKFGNK
jgi:hypothetical protein